MRSAGIQISDARPWIWPDGQRTIVKETRSGTTQEAATDVRFDQVVKLSA
jgi:hypothetical protein